MPSPDLRNILLIAVNVLYAVYGLNAIIIGISSVDKHQTISFIMTGTLALILAVFGLLGAIKENVYMLRAFGVLLGMTIALNIIQGIHVILRYGNLDEDLRWMLLSYKEYESVSEAMDHLQSKLECCGVASSRDWARYFRGSELPRSCCPKQPRHEMEACIMGVKVYTTGCLSATRKMFINCGVSVCIMLVIQIAAIALLCSLPDQQVSWRPSLCCESVKDGDKPVAVDGAKK